MSQYSLLGHVAPRLTLQVENLATESLLYLLQRYEKAREAFVDLVSTMGFVAPSDLEFDTQVRMQDGGIPDLVGATTDGTGVLLVESKFWAPLTPNQPTSYLRQLPVDREGMVLFIAPEGRYETLWQELMARCGGEGLKLTDETSQPPNWHAVRISKVSRLAYVSWPVALDHLEGQLEKAGQDRGAHEVWQLRGLCQRLDARIQIGEGSSGSEQRRTQLRSIVDEMASRLSEIGILDTRGYRATPGPGSYRRYGTLSGHVNWFVEYNERNATRFERSWLWVGGPSGEEMDRALLPRIEANPPRFYKLNKKVLFPLDVPIQGERELVIQSLITQVKGIVELLPKRDRS